jgi:hypothetical protein
MKPGEQDSEVGKASDLPAEWFWVGFWPRPPVVDHSLSMSDNKHLLTFLFFIWTFFKSLN